jgi:hypothetical protein
MAGQRVFICYGREDISHAQRLFTDLKNAGLEPWLDQEHLPGGAKWETAALQAIHKSDFFVALLSSRTAGRKGFLITEIREALRVRDSECPSSYPFVIPLRLDDCQMPDEALDKFNRIDMFPDWGMGVNRILKSVAISHRPVTAFIAIQFRRLDPDLFVRVFESSSSREYTYRGYDNDLHPENDARGTERVSDNRNRV